MSVLKVENLRKSYKKGLIPKRIEVLDDVSFELSEGSIIGFLGANGAGKTTTMKCILGLAQPDSGSVLFFGNKVLSSEVKEKIGFLPEHPYFYSYLTGYEFLKFYARLSKKYKARELDSVILKSLERVNLSAAKDKPLKSYSKGMLQKIGFAQAIIHEPKLVILDEPLSGLDPDGRYSLSQQIKEVAGLGCTILLSSHLLHDAEKLCDTLVILKQGNVEFSGSYEQLTQRFATQFELIYSLGGKTHVELMESREQIQLKIDELRKSNAEILSLQKNAEGLESYFVNHILESQR